MINAPCIKCEKKGCGSYHDQCPDYQEYKRKGEEIKKKRFSESEYLPNKRFTAKQRRIMKGEIK